MQLSPRGLAFLERWEGFSAESYADSAGYHTIGYGHKLLVGEFYPQGITREQAAQLLREDVEIAERTILRLVTVKLNQAQFDALVSFTFNLGGSAFARSTLLRSLNAGDYSRAANEFLRWSNIRREGELVSSPGLAARRAAERALFTSRFPDVAW